MEHLIRRSDELAQAGRRIDRPAETLLQSRFSRLLRHDPQSLGTFAALEPAEKRLVVELGETAQRLARRYPAEAEAMVRRLGPEGLTAVRVFGDDVAEVLVKEGPESLSVLRKTGRTGWSFFTKQVFLTRRSSPLPVSLPPSSPTRRSLSTMPAGRPNTPFANSARPESSSCRPSAAVPCEGSRTPSARPSPRTDSMSRSSDTVGMGLAGLVVVGPSSSSSDCRFGGCSGQSDGLADGARLPDSTGAVRLWKLLGSEDSSRLKARLLTIVQ